MNCSSCTFYNEYSSSNSSCTVCETLLIWPKECIENNIATANLDEPRTPYNAIYQYVQRGLYMDQIERFMKVFPNRDNILIIISELFKKNPQS